MNSAVRARRSRVVATVVASAVLTAGCGGGSGEQSPGSRAGKIDGAKALSEYRAERAKLLPEAPPGARWKEVYPYAAPNSEYEVGDGANLAEAQWECLWVNEYLSRQGQSEPEAQAALKMLDRVPLLAEWAAIDQSGKDHYAANMRKARLGDPAGFQEFSRANCSS